MIRINLLPTGRKKAVEIPPSFIYGAIAAAVVILTIIGLTFYMNSKISTIKDDISNKEEKLKQLVLTLKKVQNYEKDNAEYREKTRIIQQLKKNQIVPLRLLDEVSEKLPKGVWLTHLADKAGRITIEGFAFTNYDLVEYVQNLKNSKYLEEVMLEESRQADVAEQSIYKFKLTFKVKM